MFPQPKPVKQVKNKKRSPIKKTDVRKVIEKIDAIDSLVCLIHHDYRCILCGGTANQMHHYFHKKNHGRVRFEFHNHWPMCYPCHNIKIHIQSETEPLRDAVIDNIGFEAFEELKEKAYNGLADRSLPFLKIVLSIKEETLAALYKNRLNRGDDVINKISEAGIKKIEAIVKRVEKDKESSCN